MNQYRAHIRADKYPIDCNVQGTSWHVAAARAAKVWRQRFAREVVHELHISLYKLGENANR